MKASGIFGLCLGTFLALGASAALADEADKGAVTASATDAWEVPESFTLDNGLKVVVIPDHRAPIVTHMVWYPVGSGDEPPGKSGIAHFLEHLMFKGTETLGPGEFSETVLREGAQHNAFTSYDFTAYYERAAKDRLPKLMALEADRMANLALDEKEVLSERDVVLEERRGRLENNPSALLQAEMQAALYGAHPYSVPIIGHKAEIEALGRQDAYDFYERYYAPNKAILIVAGDVTPDEVKALAETHYGPLEPAAIAGERSREAAELPDEPQTIVRRDPRAQAVRWQRYYPAPSYASGDPETGAALDVLAQILGGGRTSRLYQDLVVKKKIAAAAGAWYSGTRLDETYFGVYAMPTAGTEPDAIEGAVANVIAEIRENGVDDAELARAKTSLIAEATYARDSHEQLANVYGQGLTTGLGLEEIAAWPADIDKVTAADVKAAAERYLDPRQSVTGILLPEEAS